jgi:hypothetical protein
MGVATLPKRHNAAHFLSRPDQSAASGSKLTKQPRFARPAHFPWSSLGCRPLRGRTAPSAEGVARPPKDVGQSMDVLRPIIEEHHNSTADSFGGWSHSPAWRFMSSSGSNR